MNMLRSSFGCGLGAALLMLAGCTGVDAGLSLGGAPTGQLDQGLDRATAEYMVLDLATGKVTPQQSISSGDSSLRDSSMAFKRISSGGEYLIGVFEVSQAQWVRIAGGTPASWAALQAAGVVPAGAIAGTMPAFALDYDEITAGLAAWNSGKPDTIAVPTAAQWSTAAGGGTYPWGEAIDRDTVAAHAVVWEVHGNGTPGPRPVGGRTANSNGLFDMGGNVWEWTAPGTELRGGSWHDGVAQTRRSLVNPALAGFDQAQHALNGIRLVLVLK